MAVEKVGAGFLFSCSGQVLLLKRQSKHNDKTWGLPGGNCDTGESLLQAATREVVEEMGHAPPGYKVVCELLTRRGKHGQKHYTVFVATISPETRAAFVPRLNKEHSDWRWFDAGLVRRPGPDSAPLHPVVQALLGDAGGHWPVLQKVISSGC